MRERLLLLAIIAAGCGDNLEAPEEVEPVPYAVDTVAAETVTAGDPINALCTLRDINGDELVLDNPPNFVMRYAPADAVSPAEDGSGFIATRAGHVEVSCTVPSLRLADETPEIVEIVAGPVAQLATTIDLATVTAGGVVTASCEGFDAWGNPVAEISPELRANPPVSENAIEGLSATMTRAGVYELLCDMPGVDSYGALVEVWPGPAASLVISRVPNRPIYAQGEIISITHIVTDQYGNPVPDAQVQVVSDPIASVSNGARFRYFEDGIYQVTATTPGMSGTLMADTIVIVDGNGPAVSCDAPGDGAVVDHVPGQPIAFSGVASDISGVQQIRVNGTPVAFDGAGAFSVDVPTRFGVNFVELAVVDENGTEATRTCSFLIADEWVQNNQTFANSITLKLRQAAIDDGSRAGSINSLADMLSAVINSDGLADAIHELLLDANPLKPMSCDQSVWLVGCVFESQIDYLESDFSGTHSVSMNLITGGLRTNLTLRNVRMRLRVTGTCNSTGWVTVSTVQTRMDFDAYLQSGRPRIAVRPSSVSTSIGSVSTDFSGVCGFVFDNIVMPFAENSVRNLIANQVTDLLRGSLNDVLDGVVGALDISSLATAFNVPRLDGGTPIVVSFIPGMSSVSAGSTRLLFGLSSRFNSAAAHARPTLGAPIPEPLGPLDPITSSPAAVGIHSGLLAQALHALWRGGFFDATITGDSLGGSFPEGASATLSTGLPPAVEIISGNRVELSLGDVSLILAYPSLFAEPVHLVLGMRASVAFSLSGDDIVFSDFSLDELHLTSQQVSLDSDTRDILEDFLAEVLGEVTGSALTDALPALPIPSFELPSSVAAYGLPAGGEFGLLSPLLQTYGTHFLLRGSVGVQ